MIECPECGPVVHQPIPEDEAHCPCQPAYWFDEVGYRIICDCDCHD